MSTTPKKLEGFVDQFVDPEGFDANDGEIIFFQKTKQLSRDTPATLFIGPGKFGDLSALEDRVRVLEEALRERGHSRSCSYNNATGDAGDTCSCRLRALLNK